MKEEFQQCIHCDSRLDIKCPQSGIVQNSRICKNYLSFCVTAIDANGYTHRQCSEADDEMKLQKNLVSTCSENNCNMDIFPPDRLQCYRCGGDEDDCDVIPSNSTGLVKKAVPCGMLSDSDKCFAYRAAGKNILNAL